MGQETSMAMGMLIYLSVLEDHKNGYRSQLCGVWRTRCGSKWSFGAFQFEWSQMVLNWMVNDRDHSVAVKVLEI